MRASKSPQVGLFLLLGLPRLAEPVALDSATQSTYVEFTAQYVDRPGATGVLTVPGPTMDYLRWLAERREVLFHGSQRDGIDVLRPDRESGDSTTFGDQRAVFATDDPVWAAWFALLARTPGLRSTRNGVWSVRGDRHNRQYFFSVDSDQPDADLLQAGWLYILPRNGFTREPPLAGILQSGQWINPHPVEPLARIAVAPTDFPFASVVGRHSATDSMLRTLLDARSSYRRNRVASRPLTG